MSWLLLRGLGREQRHWHEFPELLRERAGGARILCLDLAGMGTERTRRPVPSVTWLARDVARRVPDLEASAGTAWSVLGLSMGGMVALELCQLFPGIERAVIVNASSRLTPAHERMRPSGALAVGRSLLERDPVRREQLVLSLTSNQSARMREKYARASAEFARDAAPTRRAVLAQLLAAARFRPPPRQALRVRLSLSCGRGDRLVSPRCSHDLAKAYGTTADEHPWAGHDLPFDDPEWLCERVFGT